MKDNEIINALECCKVAPQNCDNCPMLNAECQQGLPKLALDLINRQQAEIKEKQELIDRLHEVNEQLYEEMSERQKEEVRIAKKYSILSFAERLKKKGFADEHYEHESIVYVQDIDDLVKEMVGEE